ncbi:MAG: 50S ribosomal protein L1 [Candidatus Hodarchaeota archaeon]
MSINFDKIVETVAEAKKKAKTRNFAESIDLAVNIKGIDLKRPESRIDAEVVVPNSLAKKPKICVIAMGDLAIQAKKEEADLVLAKEDLEKLATDRKSAKRIVNENDFFIASADMMPLIGRFLGPILGPRGKMPKPGGGIIPPTSDIKPVLERYSKTVRIVMKKSPVVQAKVGDKNLDNKSIAENIREILMFLEQNLDKGMQNVKSIYVKTSMGPTVKLEL